MSYYYNYFLGYINNDDNLFYPLGPYDMNGKLHSVMSISRSFASDLHDDFNVITKERFSERLKNEFSYKHYDEKVYTESVKWLPADELPKGDYIKKGYFLLRDIDAYNRALQEGEWADPSDYFYEYLSPEMFALRMQSELAFGKPKPEVDCEGEEMDVYSCRDYAYYAFPSYQSREYEAAILKQMLNVYEYGVRELENGKLVILETEG